MRYDPNSICKEQAEFEREQRLAWERRIVRCRQTNQGMTATRIGERFGVTANVVLEILKKHKVTTPEVSQDPWQDI
jgi:hypothetical protein